MSSETDESDDDIISVITSHVSSHEGGERLDQQWAERKAIYHEGDLSQGKSCVRYSA